MWVSPLLGLRNGNLIIGGLIIKFSFFELIILSHLNLVIPLLSSIKILLNFVIIPILIIVVNNNNNDDNNINNHNDYNKQ